MRLRVYDFKAGVSKVFAVRVKYRIINNGQGHTLQVTVVSNTVSSNLVRSDWRVIDSHENT